MANTFALPDGSRFVDDAEGMFALADGSRVDAGGAAEGAVALWVQDGDVVASTVVSSIAALAAITQASNTISATVLMAGSPAPGRMIVTASGGRAFDEGTRSFALDDGSRLIDSALVAIERTLDASIAQDANTLAATAEAGAIGRSLTVVLQQDDNVLAATATPQQGTFVQWTQADQVAAAAAEVKRILLAASGEVINGAAVVYTQDDQTIAAIAESGNVTINWTQQGDSIAAFAVNGRVTASSSVALQGDTIVATAVVMQPSVRWLELYFRRASGGVPGVTNVRWAWWDQQRPDALEAPADRGVATIDENGVCRIILAGSSLSPGGVGYLTLADTDGLPEQPWKQFSGPVRVR